MRNESLTRAARARMTMLCALLAAAGAASANDAADARATAESLARIENDTLLLKAEERQMAVRLQLAAQRSDLAQRHAQARSLERPAREGDPTVVAVEGIGQRLHATLMMDNGSLLEAAIGDVLPNGMAVLSVRAGEVVVGRGPKERIRLAHAAPPGVPANTGAATGTGASGPDKRTGWTLPALPLPSTMAVVAAPGGAR